MTSFVKEASPNFVLVSRCAISNIPQADTTSSRALGVERTFCLLAVSGNCRSRPVAFVMMTLAAVLKVLLTQSADFFLVVGNVAVVIDVSETWC